MLWIAYATAACIALVFVTYAIRNVLQQRSKLRVMNTVCGSLETLTVLVETEFGLVSNAVECVKRLLDNAECPRKLAVHVLEPVQSIKSQDFFLPELETACSNAPNYATFFRESVFLHKVHRVRNLTRLSAMKYILDQLTKTLHDDALIVWVPSNARVAANWDRAVRTDFASRNRRDSTQVVTYPLMQIPSAHKDVERFFFREKTPVCAFAAVHPNLTLVSLPCAREGLSSSLGISLQHIFVAQQAHVRAIIQYHEARGLNSPHDLLLSFSLFKMGIHASHGSTGIAFRDSGLFVPNRRTILSDMHDLSADPDHAIVFDAWLQFVGLGWTSDGDLQVYGRARMGMTLESPLYEILVKWGSEAALNTEREALKYG